MYNLNAENGDPLYKTPTDKTKKEGFGTLKMKRYCEICGKKWETGEKIITVEKVGKRLPFDIYYFLAWDTTFIHLKCLLKRIG